jgi:signal transduction histidine kinase
MSFSGNFWVVGAGMTIVKEIAQKHGGRAWAESGKGYAGFKEIIA